MSEFTFLYSPWSWFILAGLLLIGELLSPGIFLMWLAGAAALTGIVDYALALSWQSEVAVFALLSAALVLASWNWVKNQRTPKTDQPHLNLRHGAYVGRVFVLEKAIVNGSGKLKIFEHVLSVEEVGIYKPSRRVYRLAMQKFHIQDAPSICFVSANTWDAQAAAQFGFQVARIARVPKRDDNLPGKVSRVISGLGELAGCL